MPTLEQLLQRHRVLSYHLLPPLEGEAPQAVFKLRRGRHGDVSIRCRTNFASSIVARLSSVETEGEQPFLLPGSRDLLCIVNGGGAGISAALVAAKLGIRTAFVVCGRLGEPLCGTGTRWIDPCVYEWHYASWQQSEVKPHPGSATLLEWSADYANKIAERWVEQFNARWHGQNQADLEAGIEEEKLPLRIYDASEAQMAALHAERATADEIHEALDGILRERPKAVLITGVMGVLPSDGPWPKQFCNFRYFEDDYYGDLPEHPLSADSPKQALICSSGDSALQDLLRVCCGKEDTTRRIYTALFGPASDSRLEALLTQASRAMAMERDIAAGEWRMDRASISDFLDELLVDPAENFQHPDFLHDLLSGAAAMAETQIDFLEDVEWDMDFDLLENDSAGWLSLLSAAEESDRSEAQKKKQRENLRKVHRRYHQMVRTLAAQPALWEELQAKIAGLIRYPAQGTKDGLVLAFQGDCFDRCYPMNHLLALLIVYHLEGVLHGRAPADVWPYPASENAGPAGNLRERVLWHEHRVGAILSCAENGEEHPGGHVCRAEAADCFGHLHTVTWEHGPEASGLQDSRHNVIVVRAPRRSN